jgi:outer membrane protein TolC
VPGPAPLDDLLTAMRDGSPELKALAHAAAARRMAVSLAKAERGPVVQFRGTYALQGQWDDDLFPESDQAVSSASAALAVSMPIFDGFSAKAGIQRSEADLRTAEIELERVTRDRELSVRQARLDLENALTALEGRREGVDLAEEAHRLALVREDNGLATPLERMDAELALTEARVQLAASLYNCNLAEANLKLAVGGAAASLPATEENES